VAVREHAATSQQQVKGNSFVLGDASVRRNRSMYRRHVDILGCGIAYPLCLLL
jgi:hypothetical protein